MSEGGADGKQQPNSQTGDPSEGVLALRKEIEGALQEIVPPDRREIAVERVEQIVLAESFRGNLPHPRHLAQYEQILPGCAERVLRMTEKEQDHRHECEKDIVKAQIRFKPRGQYLGASVMFALTGCALVSLLVAHSVIGAGIFLSAATVAVVVAFINDQMRLRTASTESGDDGDPSEISERAAASSLSTGGKPDEPQKPEE